jgi:hypothetical protein
MWSSSVSTEKGHTPRDHWKITTHITRFPYFSSQNQIEDQLTSDLVESKVDPFKGLQNSDDG